MSTITAPKTYIFGAGYTWEPGAEPDWQASGLRLIETEDDWLQVEGKAGNRFIVRSDGLVPYKKTTSADEEKTNGLLKAGTWYAETHKLTPLPAPK